jgi:DHA2 family multidrug resistance protein
VGADVLHRLFGDHDAVDGWLAGRFGIKYIFLASVCGFTLASALCGAATSLTQLVLYRVLQGVDAARRINPNIASTVMTMLP